MLRAPYGWTNRMRREEGYPELGECRPGPPIGFWRNVGAAIVVYGPTVVGVVAGWLAWGGWLGVLLGVGAGLLIQMIAVLVMLPVIAFRQRHE